MKQASAEGWKLVAVVAAALVAVLYLAVEALVPRRPLDKSALELAFNVLSTLATLAAVLAALWVARQAERMADARAYAVARAVGVRHLTDLIRLEHLTSLHFEHMIKAADAKGVAAELNLVAALDRRVDVFTVDVFSRLAALDHRLVGMLAHGLSSASMAAEQANHMINWSKASGLPLEGFVSSNPEGTGACILSLMHARDSTRRVVSGLQALLGLEELRPPGWENGPPPAR